MADDHGAACEGLDRILEGPQGVDVEVVRRLVEEQDVRLASEHPSEMDPVPFAAREVVDGLLLVVAGEPEP